MTLYHLKDKPVKAVQWNGNIKVFRNALELMLKTSNIAIVVEDNIAYIAGKALNATLEIGDYVMMRGDCAMYVCKEWFEEKYEE